VDAVIFVAPAPQPRTTAAPSSVDIFLEIAIKHVTILLIQTLLISKSAVTMKNANHKANTILILNNDTRTS
jgi:hypothetical protein